MKRDKSYEWKRERKIVFMMENFPLDVGRYGFRLQIANIHTAIFVEYIFTMQM